MISRVFLAAGLAVLMLLSGIGSYVYLGSRQTNLTAAPQVPTAASPTPGAFTIPGTLFLAQSGALYSLSQGRFRQLTSAAGWTQPSIYPGDNLLVVKRSTRYSDVYVMTRFGQVIKRLTRDNTAPPGNFDTRLLHWSFYPRLSSNHKTLFMSFDRPKYGFDVPMSIWAMPLSGNMDQARLWSIAIDYTGGDVEPLPLASGALLYTKFLRGSDGKVVSQIWLTNSPERPYPGNYVAPPPGPGHGTPLTRTDEDCSQPALSPDGHTLAMICTHNTQEAYLTVASWNGRTLGPRRDLITNQLVAQPAWAPDGSGIAYLAPAVVGAGFQLWWLPRAAYAPPTPSPVPSATPTSGAPISTPTPARAPAVKPVQVTSNLAFDATSPIAWIP